MRANLNSLKANKRRWQFQRKEDRNYRDRKRQKSNKVNSKMF